MNRISDDNNLGNANTIWGLVDTALNGKKFCFGTNNVNHMIDGLGDGVIIGVCMWYRYSNVVFDAGICDYNGGRRGVWKLDNYIVKLLSASFIVFLFVIYIKYELIWEIVNNSITGRKFRMKKSKRRENSIKPVVHIY